MEEVRTLRDQIVPNLKRAWEYHRPYAKRAGPCRVSGGDLRNKR